MFLSFWLIFSTQADAFANKLGYGKDLQAALVKLQVIYLLFIVSMADYNKRYICETS